MTRPGYAQLQDVILDAEFPELDLALRRGRHVDRDDVAWYALLGDAQDHLEAFYRRYGCELVHKADGYYYLLPTGDKLSRRQLSASDMLVGQALALLYLHPSTVERAGLHTMEELIAQLAAVMGTDALIRAGTGPCQYHNNCSGKHTSMLAFAKMRGLSLDNYLSPAHPIQQDILKTLSEMCNLDVQEIQLGVDGCSAPNFALPLFNAALGMARMCDQRNLSEARAIACKKITTAMHCRLLLPIACKQALCVAVIFISITRVESSCFAIMKQIIVACTTGRMIRLL